MVSYDMEDVLDTFLVRVEGHEPATSDRFKRLLKTMAKLFNKTKASHKIASAVKDIKKQLQEVADRRGRYMVGDIMAKSTVTIVDPRLSALYNDVTKLIGIDKASDELISMLSSQGDDRPCMDKVKKVSVLGPGGLGKTTLVKTVYEKLKTGFCCGAFVPAGRNPDFKKVFKDILIDLDKQHYTTCFNMMILDERQLIDELRGFLKNKRYFVVIDDIWETQSWETIKLALIENNCGSRIATTTRKFKVATEVDDSIISKDPLIWKWVAEGFVHKEKGIGLFELGEGHFNELIHRSMIQAVEFEEEEGIVQGCRVHDMVLDLIRSLSHEEKFLSILDGLDSEETLSQSSARRLAHQNRTLDHNPQARNMGMGQLRSFVTCYCAINKMVPLSSFRVLRVLAIEHCEFMEGYQLEHLGNLHHLRYLGLIETNIRMLPKEIGHLSFLQTLLLNGTGIEVLPSSLRMLTQLMCIRADWKTRAPNWIGMITSLEELRIYRSADDRSSRRLVKELGNLAELRVLRVGIAVLDESMERDLVKSLKNLRKIQYLQLEIVFPDVDDTVDASPWMSKVSWEAEGFVLPRHLRRLLLGCIIFSRLPSWINSSCLPNLTHLCVHVVAMDEEDLKVIGKMPELRDLLLPTSSTNGEGAMTFGPKKDGEGRVAPTVMPSLEFLEFFFFVRTLKDCNNDCSNIGLECLKALQKVTVRIGCQGASVSEVEEAEAALRHAAEVHPNHVILEPIRHFEDQMILASDHS
ncbi:unnamed protein product [Urochloa decumbens]|uniref:NB-ARC domain-containing protein n=1 Tax=Urochloa decumbens TaxID=240449 RepID=A0ABC9AWH4_9POAL